MKNGNVRVQEKDSKDHAHS